MAYYVYVLFSDSLDCFYIGSSANPEERLKKHLARHKGFTSRAKDWIICYKEKFESKTDAVMRERQLKNWKNKDLIRKLVNTGPVG